MHTINAISIPHHCTYKRSSTLGGREPFSLPLTLPPAQHSHIPPNQMSESYTQHLSDQGLAYAIASVQSYLQPDEVLAGRRRGYRRFHHQTQNASLHESENSMKNSASESGYSPSRSLGREESERPRSFVSTQQKAAAKIPKHSRPNGISRVANRSCLVAPTNRNSSSLLRTPVSTCGIHQLGRDTRRTRGGTGVPLSLTSLLYAEIS